MKLVLFVIIIILIYWIWLCNSNRSTKLKVFEPYILLIYYGMSKYKHFSKEILLKWRVKQYQLDRFLKNSTKVYFNFIRSKPKNFPHWSGDTYLRLYLMFLGLTDFLVFIITRLPKLPYLFFRFLFLATFPAFITYVLVVFCYRTYYNLNLKTPLLKPLPSRKRFVLLVVDKFSNFLYKYTVLQQTRTHLWNITLESLTDNFFFLKKYYRLNDLIWQDGFLIDFLQKKVADRWVRTFIIYSGYLFSERFLFDIVVRFYIDFIIWPTYNNSLYEFSSVSATLTVTLLILMKLFLLISVYNIILLF